VSSISSSSRAGTRGRPAFPMRGTLRLLAMALTAGMLAACAQQAAVVTSPNRQAALEPAHHKVVRHRSPAASEKQIASTKDATYGLASFYSYDPHTASGEKFNKQELTAAHRTLPFGTRLRVTDVATGRSVTVRVNDRGPFVPGRVVDVSASAAESLGITGKGVAKVKLDVVEAK
jgi:peptidoglycan lytic transglycosylase